MPDPRPVTSFRHRANSRQRAASVRGPVLIVDDNPDDAKLAQRAFERLHPQFPIHMVGSGVDLVKHLEGITASTNAGAAVVIPSVILLDLKMPEMDGFTILKWMANQPQFTGIPVIILSTFDDLLHVKQAYSLGARSYLLKPISGDSLRDALSSLNIAV